MEPASPEPKGGQVHDIFKYEDTVVLKLVQDTWHGETFDRVQVMGFQNCTLIKSVGSFQPGAWFGIVQYDLGDKSLEFFVTEGTPSLYRTTL